MDTYLSTHLCEGLFNFFIVFIFYLTGWKSRCDDFSGSRPCCFRILSTCSSNVDGGTFGLYTKLPNTSFGIGSSTSPLSTHRVEMYTSQKPVLRPICPRMASIMGCDMRVAGKKTPNCLSLCACFAISPSIEFHQHQLSRSPRLMSKRLSPPLAMKSASTESHIERGIEKSPSHRTSYSINQIYSNVGVPMRARSQSLKRTALVSGCQNVHATE